MIRSTLWIILAFVAAGCGAIEIPPAPEDLCATYCDKVIETCGVDDSLDGQYISAGACEIYCKDASAMPKGTDGDKSGNSVECRTFHAGAAALDPETHCPHAGPTGGGVCGGYCDVYCQLMTSNCEGKFATEAECRAACEPMPTSGFTHDDIGDSVQCRITYAGFAGTERGSASGSAQCDKAMPVSTFCTKPTNCGDFCAEVTTACQYTDAYYKDVADCVATCTQFAGWEAGVLGDTDSNSVGCRHNFAKQAAATSDATEKTQFCKNASPTGGDVCEPLCDNWCHYLERNCATTAVKFDTRADCFNACEAFSSDGKPGDLSGNNVQCRISYALSAGDPANSGSIESICTSASASSSNCK